MEYDESKTDEKFWKPRSTRSFGGELASTHLCMEQLDEIRALRADRRVSCTDKQGGTAHHAQQTDLTNRLHLTCSTNREKNNKGKTRGRHPSANRKRQPQQTSVMRKLDYTSRFVRVIPTLSPNQSSHNSKGHGGRYNMVVTASTSQQIKWTTAKERVYSDSVL